MKYILDATCMQERKSAHEYLKKVLNLPDYYGGNLDALYDCVYDMDRPEIEIINMTEADKDEDSYIKKVLFVLDAAHAVIRTS
ncbi:MAG: barstar family protein [Lachnospiraceae bacterium]|nr:barstar family protein [Lachnospiraceae bacterium]